MPLCHCSRCGVVGRGGLKVFIHPPSVWTKPSGDEVSTQRIKCTWATLHFSMSSKVAALTTEYYEMLEAVYSSPYYTEDPSEACLFIPSIDLLNLQEQVIQNLYQELFILWCGPLNSTSSHLDTNHPTQSDPLKLTTLHPSLTCWYDFTQPRATVSLLPSIRALRTLSKLSW